MELLLFAVLLFAFFTIPYQLADKKGEAQALFLEFEKQD
jgi:hypothetical protein